jgi:hypothetical protein
VDENGCKRVFVDGKGGWWMRTVENGCKRIFVIEKRVW